MDNCQFSTLFSAQCLLKIVDNVENSADKSYFRVFNNHKMWKTRKLSTLHYK